MPIKVDVKWEEQKLADWRSCVGGLANLGFYGLFPPGAESDVYLKSIMEGILGRIKENIPYGKPDPGHPGQTHDEQEFGGRFKDSWYGKVIRRAKNFDFVFASLFRLMPRGPDREAAFLDGVAGGTIRLYTKDGQKICFMGRARSAGGVRDKLGRFVSAGIAGGKLRWLSFRSGIEFRRRRKSGKRRWIGSLIEQKAMPLIAEVADRKINQIINKFIRG
jgi:hypothetical protein